MHMYIYIYTYIHIYTYICTYIYIYIYIHATDTWYMKWVASRPLWASIEAIVTGHSISAAIALQRWGPWPFQEVIHWRYRPYINQSLWFRAMWGNIPSKPGPKHGFICFFVYLCISPEVRTEMGWVSDISGRNTQNNTFKRSPKKPFGAFKTPKDEPISSPVNTWHDPFHPDLARCGCSPLCLSKLLGAGLLGAGAWSWPDPREHGFRTKPDGRQPRGNPQNGGKKWWFNGVLMGFHEIVPFGKRVHNYGNHFFLWEN